MVTLLPRQSYYRCTDSFGNVVSCNSAWYDWGRWVALTIVILGFLFLFIICSCISSRRRRRRGMQPYYGTGWAGRNGHGQATYAPQYGQQQQQQQPYYGQQQAPPTYQQTYDPNRGYYGQPQTPSTGVYEMQPQQPNPTYQGTSPEVTGPKR